MSTETSASTQDVQAAIGGKDKTVRCAAEEVESKDVVLRRRDGWYCRIDNGKGFQVQEEGPFSTRKEAQQCLTEYLKDRLSPTRRMHDSFILCAVTDSGECDPFGSVIFGSESVEDLIEEWQRGASNVSAKDLRIVRVRYMLEGELTKDPAFATAVERAGT